MRTRTPISQMEEDQKVGISQHLLYSMYTWRFPIRNQWSKIDLKCYK